MKILKIFAIVFAAIVLIVGGVAGYLIATFDAARLKQEIAAAVEKRTGRTLRIEGDLSLAFWPNLAVQVGRTTLSEPGGAGEFARLESASVAVAMMPLLSGQVQVREVAIDGLAATVVKKRDGSLNIDDLRGAPADGTAKVDAGETAPGPAPKVDVAAIRIAKARLDWRDERTGKAFSLADLALESGPIRFADGVGRIASLGLGAVFTSAGHRLTARLTLSGIASEAAALKIERFALDADAKLADAHAVAKLASPVALDTAKQTVALTQLAGQLDFSHPRLPMKTLALPLSGAASADLAKRSAALRLDTKLDESTVKAKLDIGRFAPLALAFDLDIDRLDLDRYLPKEKPAGGDGRIDLAALKGLNLSGTAKIGQLTVAKVKASDIRVRLEAKDGRVDIAPLSANLYDGRLEGSLSANAHGNRFAAKQNLGNVRIAPLLKDLADQDLLTGRASLALDIAAQGETVDALKKTLAGTARIALADGAIKGINLGQKLREVRGMLAGGRNIDVANDATQQTDFSELAASFRITDGVAKNDDLAAKSPLLRLAGAGDIDIGNGRLDYLLKTSIVATAQGQGGQELASLRGLTIPVRLTGPFEKPAWRIEFASLATEAAKAKVEEKKEELQQKVEEKVKDRLRGLLGR